MDFFKKLTSKKKSKSEQASASPQEPKLYSPNPNASKPRGILKNKNDTKKYCNTNAYPTSDDIDESLRNAQKNSSINQSLGATPENEEAKKKNDNNNNKDIDDKQKDIKWDEDNLEKNEREKVPRMKIDEPPTPFAELPMELQNDLEYNDNDEVEEIILDKDPMENEMSLDDDHQSDLYSNDSHSNDLHSNDLNQKQQSLLLGDDQFRQKMVNDAINRRQNNGDSNEKKKNDENMVLSAWEINDDQNNDNTPSPNKEDESEASGNNEMDLKKEKFKKKRKAHYNEYHAIKAWRAKQQQQQQENNNNNNNNNNND